MGLIIIDGLDGSGKTTQAALLAQAFEKRGQAAECLKFPNYEDKSSALVQMYLNGEIADTPDKVNPYAAAAFYACDRYISYMLKWGESYRSGKTLICDRYVTSNAIHQTAKLASSDRDGFLAWMDDFEYNKLRLPRPDLVICLDMDSEISSELLMKRYDGDEDKKDIHEQSLKYLRDCRESALYAAEKLGWIVIRCFENGKPLPIEIIHEKILDVCKLERT